MCVYVYTFTEQVKELKQEVIRQEDQLREVRKNSTNLEKKLEYESLQCGRQIAELKAEYEESKTRVEEAAKLRQSLLENRKVDTGGRQVEADLDQSIKRKEDTAEIHTVAARRNDGPLLKDDLGKPGSDAGMPGIEDSEVGKMEDAQFALKKPAITPQKHMEPAEAEAMLKEVRAGFGAGAGAGARPGDDLARGEPLDRPDLPHDENLNLGNNDMPLQQQLPNPVIDKPMLFDKDNKAVIKADEFGEQRRQLGAEGLKAEGVGLPPPPNPAQVHPKHIDQHKGRDPALADLPRHRQNDEDREAPGERAVDYGKRHQAIDVL